MSTENGISIFSPTNRQFRNWTRGQGLMSTCFNAGSDKKNEVSGLMIMGLFGGTVFPLAMGVAADAVGQTGAVAVMTVGVIYLLIYTLKIKK